MHPARPQAPAEPCLVCGQNVDPYRAHRLVALGQGDGCRNPRFFPICSAGCEAKFREGSVPLPAAVHAAPVHSRSVPQQVREATLPRIDLEGASASHRSLPVIANTTVPVASLATSAVALLAGLGASSMPLAFVSAVLTVAAAALTLYSSRPLLKEAGLLPWLLGPVGAILASLAALIARLQAAPEDSGLWLAPSGAAIAAGAMALRHWLDTDARHPIEDLIASLQSRLPRRVRVPAEASEGQVRYREIPLEKIRTGEEVLVVEGETIPVDGIILGGEAQVLAHPSAQAPIPRSTGMSVVAGAKLAEGAIRVQATHVGNEGALHRVASFGALRHSDAARITQLATRVTAIGGVAAVVAAALGLFFLADGTFSGRLGAFAAVLLGAPLLAARRSASSPLLAAAASAAHRGIIFRTPRSLERAGQVTTTALCTSGTVTEGTPELVEVETLDDQPAQPLLALAAGVEGAAGDHPVALGIRDYTTRHGILPEPVRRATVIPGRGLTAVAPSGENIVIGNRALLLQQGISVAIADADAMRAESRGHTAVFLGLGGRVRAVLQLRDELRVGARAAVQRMFDQRMEVLLLSGDHRTTVEALAKPLDVTHVKAELLPDERGEEVRRLCESGAVVATIGRHPSDNAALGAAHVPIHIGAAGASVSERGIALTTNDLRDASSALWIAGAARREARRTLLLAVAGGSLLVALSSFGWLPPTFAALLSLGIDAYSLPTAQRLLERIERRIPTR